MSAKKKMVWAPSNGFSDDPYEEDRMGKRFSGQKEKGMNAFEKWLLQQGEIPEGEYQLPLICLELPCGCKPVCKSAVRITIKGEAVNVNFSLIPLRVRKRGNTWYCVKCGKSISKN